jgi:hypothetical protein
MTTVIITPIGIGKGDSLIIIAITTITIACWLMIKIND